MKNNEIFGNIYRNKVWGEGSQASPLSGSGSDPKNAITYVNFVRDFISSRNITSVVDVGHGDWQMWKDYSFSNVKYLGLDVAAGLSEDIERKFGNSLRKFQYYDVESSNLPNADLLICKDVLQHLSRSDAKTLLAQMNQFKYLIICNDIYLIESIIFEVRNFLQLKERLRKISKFQLPLLPYNRRNNSEIKSGDFRGIDLKRKPFRSAIKDHEIISIIDYDGPTRQGIKKRIYLLARNL